ncbi:peptidylprolyl isomerase [Bacteroides sp. UBA939]|uniref:peptidylprolyl isomerase n=1 Tax=Bacteroides sp. UBA939 TaxID=1946092 RepID=UPI0025BD81A9|nr:peptidylprolyl isomerase [Bacteroides sp. UBA939]
MIRSGLIIILLFIGQAVLAQQDPVLMRINGKGILRSEFEYIYNKNNALTGVEQKTLAEYMDLFVNFKLKVAVAEAAGIDTTRSFREELEGYRRQLAESYLTDEVVVELPARQAYEKVKANHRFGHVRVSHVFKYLPQTVTGSTLLNVESRMDSIYLALQQGLADFETCVRNFSDEKKPFWVSWLQMPAEFEDVVFKLAPGEISRPFFTPQGIHIVKVLERKETLPFESQTNQEIEVLVDKLKKEYQYTPDKTGVNELLLKGGTHKRLFVLDGKEYTGDMFAHFAAAHPAGMQRQLDGFIMKSVLDYEYGRLEQKHPDFRLLMQEYRDGMLLFEISNREIWERVSSDEAGLDAYFKKHRSDYHWEIPRYKGIVLHTATKRIGKQVRKFLKSLPEEEWQGAIRLMFNSQGQVKAEQGLFAIGDNAYVDEKIFKQGRAEPMASFPFVTYLGEKVKGPETYQEVRGLLMKDYQNYLEAHWVAQLRAAAKIEINQEVLKTVNNH